MTDEKGRGYPHFQEKDEVEVVSVIIGESV